MKNLTILAFCLMFTFISCKKCYECDLNVICAACVDNFGSSITFCDNETFFFNSEVSDYEAIGYTCILNSAVDEREICGSGIVGKSLLFTDKESLEFDGYICTEK